MTVVLTDNLKTAIHQGTNLLVPVAESRKPLPISAVGGTPSKIFLSIHFSRVVNMRCSGARGHLSDGTTEQH